MLLIVFGIWFATNLVFALFGLLAGWTRSDFFEVMPQVAFVSALMIIAPAFVGIYLID